MGLFDDLFGNDKKKSQQAFGLFSFMNEQQNKNNGEYTEEESYADLTINLTDLMIPDEDYIFVNGDMTRDLRNFLEEKGIISESIETYQYNMGKYDMVQVDFDLLKQYDPDGFKDFEKTKSKDMEI